jgi:purine-binding chemotaxis protein CheW
VESAGAHDTSRSSGTEPVLLVKVGHRLCSLGLASTIEVMRAQPCEPLAGAPAFVRGVSVIRGQAVPVVDLHLLLEGRTAGTAARLVTVRVGPRMAALAVDQVLGLLPLSRALLSAAPPLLGPSGGALIEDIGALDAELVVTLRTARLVPDEVWTLVDQPREADA